MDSAAIRTEQDNQRSLLSYELWQALREWYREHGRHNLPWRTDQTPWKVLIAETLLHRTRADAVQAVYARIVGRFLSPAEVVNRSPEWIDMTSSIGLAWRSQAFVSLCRDLLSRFDGEVPSDRAKLLTLPGVGHYVASAVRCFGFALCEVVVDTNTIRLASRISGSHIRVEKHRTVAARTLVCRLAPYGRCLNAADNYALLDLAALVCHPSWPRHAECPLLPACITGQTQETLPKLVGDERNNG